MVSPSLNNTFSIVTRPIKQPAHLCIHVLSVDRKEPGSLVWHHIGHDRERHNAEGHCTSHPDEQEDAIQTWWRPGT